MTPVLHGEAEAQRGEGICPALHGPEWQSWDSESSGHSLSFVREVFLILHLSLPDSSRLVPGKAVGSRRAALLQEGRGLSSRLSGSALSQAEEQPNRSLL